MKKYTHKVSINEKRRSNKMSSDTAKKGKTKGNIQYVYNTFYRDQVKALYNSVTEDK